MNNPDKLSDGATEDARSLARMVRRLYETRQAAAQAKKARAELAARLGPCVESMENRLCYHSREPQDQWCDVCKAKQPVWEDYRRKVAVAAAALRDVMRVGKRMEPKRDGGVE